MLDNCTTKEERWDGVSEIIDRWLTERQELIVIYCSLSGTHNFAPNCKKSQEKLRKFCQIMMDYVSAGHFEVYDQLIKEAEAFEDSNEQLVAQLFLKINQSTEMALDFNDKYDTDDRYQQASEELSAHLSKLGEVLVSRFDMEDRLIEILHNAHAELVV